MQIFLNLNGQQQGPYTAEDIEAWLAEEQLAPDTPAWHEGLPEWIPVAELVEASTGMEAGEVLLYVEHQDEYSRGELAARTFLGLIYIDLPHGLCLLLLGAASTLLWPVVWVAVLVTGRYPERLFLFTHGVLQWLARWAASGANLVDGFPAFGLGNRGAAVDFAVEPVETVSRSHAALRLLAVVYVVVPHGVCLWFRGLTSGVLAVIMFWVVLFTGRYPRAAHDFNVGTLRWALRMLAYVGMLTDRYPRFSGKG